MDSQNDDGADIDTATSEAQKELQRKEACDDAAAKMLAHTTVEVLRQYEHLWALTEIAHLSIEQGRLVSVRTGAGVRQLYPALTAADKDLIAVFCRDCIVYGG